MQYLESLEECFDSYTQRNLFERIKIRLGRTQIFCVKGEEINIPGYVSEAVLKKNYPINQNKLKFEAWTCLRKEIENKTVEFAQSPGLLESSLIKYMKPFEVSSIELYIKDAWGQSCEEGTGFLLRFAASRICGDHLDHAEQFLFASLFLETMEQPKPPWSKKMVDGLVRDLAQLNRLINCMSCVGEIIQGVLFEINAPSSLTLQTLQHNSGVHLTDTLLAYRMAPLMGWTNEYCVRLMGNRAQIHLNEEDIIITTPHPDNPAGHGNEAVVAQTNNEEMTDSTPSRKKKVGVKDATDPIDREKLHALGKKLNKEGFVKLKEDTDTWFFCYPRQKMRLYAYMMWKVAEARGLTRIPWQYLTERIEPPKGVTCEDLRKEANKLKNGTIKAPSGYAPIDDAIKSVFGSSQRTSNDVGSINKSSPAVLRTKIK